MKFGLYSNFGHVELLRQDSLVFEVEMGISADLEVDIFMDQGEEVVVAVAGRMLLLKLRISEEMFGKDMPEVEICLLDITDLHRAPLQKETGIVLVEALTDGRTFAVFFKSFFFSALIELISNFDFLLVSLRFSFF